MNKSEIDALNEAFNLKLHTEVERRATEWLVAAKGADWTKMYLDQQSQVQELITENDAFESENATLKHEFKVLQAGISINLRKEYNRGVEDAAKLFEDESCIDHEKDNLCVYGRIMELVNKK